MDLGFGHVHNSWCHRAWTYTAGQITKRTVDERALKGTMLRVRNAQWASWLHVSRRLTLHCSHVLPRPISYLHACLCSLTYRSDPPRIVYYTLLYCCACGLSSRVEGLYLGPISAENLPLLTKYRNHLARPASLSRIICSLH